jgi:SAM-dependent methyltransferase
MAGGHGRKDRFDVQTPTAAPAAASPMSPEPANDVEGLVGERTVPDLWHENYWFRRHEAAYLHLAPLVTAATTGRDVVLEAGAGEGYGVDLLRRSGAATVVALDYDAGTVAHGAARYPQAAWLRGNLAKLPFAAGSVAAVSSFQVIEHLWTPWEFLAECARVLRPGAPLVVTTPNRPVFSPGVGRLERPSNPYHVREFDAEELLDTIATQLTVESVLGLVHGPPLQEWEARHGDVVAAQLGTSPAAWPAALSDLVASVTAADFEIVRLWSPTTGWLAPGEMPQVVGEEPRDADAGTGYAVIEATAGDARPVHDLLVVARRGYG